MTMANYNSLFPFAAVVGQEKLKQALLLCAVNPQIGGVVISGEKGTAKSTLIRALRELMDVPFVELPLNITEDRLVGSIDLETAVQTGEILLCPGLLHKAHGGILYADEVNLLPRQIVNILLETAASGVNRVEREGLSLTDPASFVLIGSMTPEEGALRSSLLDRFGLYVEAHGTQKMTDRQLVMTRRLAYEQNPLAFRARWSQATADLRRRIQQAKQQLSQVSVPESCVRYASQLAIQGLCQGHRAELTLIETALALAAWECRLEVTQEDVKCAASMVLPHRLREALELPDAPSPMEESSAENNDTGLQAPPVLPENSEPLSPEAVSASVDEPSSEEIQDIQPIDQDLSLPLLKEKKMASLGTGKRLKVRSDTSRGRYVRYRLPRGKVQDIAVDATLRAAVLSGRNFMAASDTPGITVRSEDFREKIREQRTGAQILFVVDASGSMGARRRMGAVKGAVVAMLTDAYQKRDMVGILAFRGKDARMLLPFTRSIDLAQKCLRNLPTGGRTPLAAGLSAAALLLQAQQHRNHQIAQLLVLVSDGRANIGGDDPFQEALDAGQMLRRLPCTCLVLDTEQGFAKFGMAKQIANAMGAEYCSLSGVSQQEILGHIEKYLQ